MEKKNRQPETTVYTNFLFLKADRKFRHLMSNERIAAKQELENTVCAVQEEVFLRTYSLVGLDAGSDMLLWMAAPDIGKIQKAWSRVSTSGAGRYFDTALCFIGMYPQPEGVPSKKEAGGVPAGLFGKSRYMLLHPLVREHAWYELSEAERGRFLAERQTALAKYPSVTEHFFHSCGLDEQEFIVVRESDALDDLAAASRELREQRIKMFTKRDTPNPLCVGDDLRNILDSLG
ncbi:MAG: chlorite dismutase family protein [Elusimicrobiales bacterium]|nr:chlorite dismutase family protein [Elusimicrobiales bacterium]